MSFADLGLSDDVLRAVGDAGYTEPTPIQKQAIPVVLMGSDYWDGLLGWVRGTMMGEGKIGPKDLDLVTVTDSPEEAVARILAGYEEQRAQAEQEALRREKRKTLGDPGKRGQ